MARFDDPWASRRAALRGHLARARDFARRIETGRVENAADLAGREGLTRARVSQLLRLLKLSPVILADIEDVEGTGPVPTEAELRKLAGTKKVRDITRKGQSKITRAERKLEKMKKKELAKQEGDLVKAGSPGRCC